MPQPTRQSPLRWRISPRDGHAAAAARSHEVAGLQGGQLPRSLPRESEPQQPSLPAFVRLRLRRLHPSSRTRSPTSTTTLQSGSRMRRGQPVSAPPHDAACGGVVQWRLGAGDVAAGRPRWHAGDARRRRPICCLSSCNARWATRAVTGSGAWRSTNDNRLTNVPSLKRDRIDEGARPFILVVHRLPNFNPLRTLRRERSVYGPYVDTVAAYAQPG